MLKTDLSKVFFNFWHGQVRENVSSLLERAPLNWQNSKFERDLLKNDKDIAPKSHKRLQTLKYSVGYKLAPYNIASIQTYYFHITLGSMSKAEKLWKSLSFC